MGQMDGGAQPVTHVRERAIEPKRPVLDVGLGSQKADDGVDGDSSGDFPGPVAAHTVGDDAQVARFVERPTVFIAGRVPALVGDSVRTQHTSVIGVSRCDYTSTYGG